MRCPANGYAVSANGHGIRSGIKLLESVTMPNANKILIEVMYKADYCLPCFYMDQTVLEVLAKYVDSIEYHRVDFLRGEGKKRFLELSYSLYGEETVNKHCRVAPVPSLFIDGELVFDAIPPIFELEDAIEEAIQQKRPNQMR
jgi:thiol-disulfide isomerase/thioredoxin